MATIIKGKNARKPHTVRYWADGRQRERSFATATEARDFRAKVDHDTRAGTFVDSKLSEVPFIEYAAGIIEGMAVSEGTRKVYTGILNVWVAPFAGARSLAKVANDREGVQRLVNVTMRSLSFNRRGIALTVLNAAVSEAVHSGRLSGHKLAGIKLIKDDAVSDEHKGFIFPSFADIEALATQMNGYGIVVWLMRGAGLRIREALAVKKENFLVTREGIVLRINGQASVNGDKKLVLKHRANGKGRDIPVPQWLWSKVADLPEGVIAKPHNTTGNPYLSYSVVYKRFMKVASELGISEEFTPHSLRHSFATNLLTRGVPIHAVAEFLGHSDVAITSKIYAHVLPSTVSQARSVLDGEFIEWKAGQ